jgi:hypothetical protein
MSIPFAELNKILHPCQSGRMFTVFFRTYIDESEDQDTRTYAVGGFVGKASVWDELQPKWLDKLPPGISYFHATDCFRGAEEFSDMGISEREHLLDELTDLIVAHEVMLVAGTIDVSVYEKLAAKPKENDFGGNKYSGALEFAIKNACQSMDSSPIPREIKEQCAFVMERNEYSPSAERKIISLRANPHLWWRNRIGISAYGMKIGPSAIPLLQVADLGAFLAAKSVVNAPQGRIAWRPYWEKLENERRIFGIEMCDKLSLKIMFGIHGSMEKDVWDDLDEKGTGN